MNEPISLETEQSETFLCDQCGRLSLKSWIVVAVHKKGNKKSLCFCSVKCKKDRLNKEKIGVYED